MDPVFHRIRWKIVGPYLVLTLIGAFAGTYIVTELVTASLDERFTNQLAEAARVTEDSAVRQEQGHLETVRSVAFTQGLPEAVASGDATTAGEIILPIAVNDRAAQVEVLDSTGLLLSGFERTGDEGLDYAALTRGLDRSALAPVASVIAGISDARGDKFAGIVERDGSPVFLTAGPILDGTSLVGIVAVSTPLSEFLMVIQSEALAQVTLYGADGVALGSTFATDPANLVSAGGEPGLRETISLFGREYELLYRPLQLRGEELGWFSVGLPTTFITSAQGATRARLGTLFAVGALLILGIGIFMARAITQPLLRLVRSAVQLGEGDLTARANVRSRDEVGVLATTFNEMAGRLERQHLATLGALVSAIDARDPYTRGHSVRVGHLSMDLGRQMGMDRAQLHYLQVGGYLHDIGKIGIRDAVLQKPGSLTPEERRIVEQHPLIGLDILSYIDLPPQVVAIVGQHHEKLDGSGYPFGIGEAELDAYPRIAAVADIYDALSTSRPYREAMSIEAALGILQKEAMSGLLDVDIVAHMNRIAEAWELRRQTEPALTLLPLLGTPAPRDAGQFRGQRPA
jgi:putative nucleotidyltransferase with HDIG domain